MLIGSICSGYGGLELGVRMALGGEVAYHAEIDPRASKVLTARFPGVPNLGDLAEVPWKAIKPVDVLCAGFPCQPVSGAGERKGMDDERWLWPLIEAAIGDMEPRPRLLVLENVAGLLSAGGGHVLASVIHGLARLGYVGRYGLYRASDAGAPHHRKRWFCVAADAERGGFQQRGEPGILGGEAQAEPGERRQRQRPGDPAEHRSPVPSDAVLTRLQGLWRDTGQATGGASPPGRGHGPAGSCLLPPDADFEPSAASPVEGRSGLVAPVAGHQEPGGSGDGQHADDADPAGEGLQGSAREGLASAGGPPGGPDVGIDWGIYPTVIARWEAILGRRAPRPVVPGRSGNRLNPVFVEWMMGLPEGWVTEVPGVPRSAQLRILGNGVVPQQAALAISSLLPHPEEVVVRPAALIRVS